MRTSIASLPCSCLCGVGLCKSTGFQDPSPLEQGSRTFKPALGEETQESWFFGAGVPTGKLVPQLRALPTRSLCRV